MLTLHDIGLKNHTLDTLPRLKELRALSFARTPEICIERARHVTRYLRDLDDPADAPEVRQAKKVRHYLRERQPLFHDRNLIAGSTTSKPLGAPLFPEFFALYLWPELDTVSDRAQNPQRLTAAEARELNLEIFPYWLDRTVLERTRQRIGDATCLNLFESLVFFIASKAGCISHCVPSYRPMLELGLNGLIARAGEREAAARARGDAESRRRAEFYQAVQIALEGVITYAEHLAAEARRLHPSCQILYTSGYPQGTLPDDRPIPAAANFLQKPCSRDVLARAVRQVLDEPARAALAPRVV